MKTELMNVTPAMCRQWLKRNTINRPLRPSYVAALKVSFLRGEYVTTHQGLAFDVDGNVLDGQHRMTAIAEMHDGATFRMMVTTGLNRMAFTVVDNGLKRSASDVLGIPQSLAAVANYFATIYASERGAGVTSVYLIPFVERFRARFDEVVTFCPTARKTWGSAAVRAAAIIAIERGANPDYVKSLYRALVLADYTALPPVACALYRQYESGKANARSYDLMVRAMRAFDEKAAQNTRIQVKDQAATIAELRQWLGREVFGEVKPKKTAPTNGAKTVSKPSGDYRIAAMTAAH